jgi:hypothetical protein
VDGSIHLTAGTRYYIEMDHQQGGGGQGAAVTYKFAGAADPVAGDTPLFSSSQISTIQALDGNAIVITNQPQSVSVSSGNNATFSVVAGSYTVGSPAAPPLYYQWQEKSSGAGIFTDIPGATAQTYTTPLLSLGDSGSQFRVVLTTPGAQTNSAAATVTVTSLAPPVLSITRSGTNVVISWSPAGGTLWSSPVAGPSATWISLGTSQPYTAPLGSSNAFFRVTVP